MQDKVCTRFAPTLSGDLHIGSLYNALLNYLYAAKNDGLFKLRIDGVHLTTERQKWQDSIQRDLELFGLNPVETIKASDRVELYKQHIAELDRTCERSYHCTCNNQDLLKRASIDDSNFNFLYRPEKYPPLCKICQIKVITSSNDINVAADCNVIASHESMLHPAKVLTSRVAKNGVYWEPFDSGFAKGCPTEEQSIQIELKEATEISTVEITWKDRPVLHYAIFVIDSLGKTRKVSECKKEGKYFYDIKMSQCFKALTNDTIQFAPVVASSVILKIYNSAKPIDRPYFYDNHCRDLKRDFCFDKDNNTLRLKFDESIYHKCVDFVTGKTFPEVGIPKVDSAYYLDKVPNLVFTSPFDDKELQVTHLIRGIDIYPFFIIESQVAMAINALVKNQTYHRLIIDNRGYKYSKFVESTAVRSYLSDKITTNQIMSYLAYVTGIVPEARVYSLEEMVELFDIKNIAQEEIHIDEKEMIERIKDFK